MNHEQIEKDSMREALNQRLEQTIKTLYQVLNEKKEIMGHLFGMYEFADISLSNQQAKALHEKVDEIIETYEKELN
jgi:flagellin-specific chaperone FliS